MKDLLEKVYKKVIYYEQEYTEAGRRIDEDVSKLVEPYKNKLNENEVEELQNLMYTANYTAMYEGFMLGVRTTVKTLFSILLD